MANDDTRSERAQQVSRQRHMELPCWEDERLRAVFERDEDGFLRVTIATARAGMTVVLSSTSQENLRRFIDG